MNVINVMNVMNVINIVNVINVVNVENVVNVVNVMNVMNVMNIMNVMNVMNQLTFSSIDFLINQLYSSLAQLIATFKRFLLVYLCCKLKSFSFLQQKTAKQLKLFFKNPNSRA